MFTCVEKRDSSFVKGFTALRDLTKHREHALNRNRRKLLSSVLSGGNKWCSNDLQKRIVQAILARALEHQRRMRWTWKACMPSRIPMQALTCSWAHLLAKRQVETDSSRCLAASESVTMKLVRQLPPRASLRYDVRTEFLYGT